MFQLVTSTSSLVKLLTLCLLLLLEYPQDVTAQTSTTSFSVNAQTSTVTLSITLPQPPPPPPPPAPAPGPAPGSAAAAPPIDDLPNKQDIFFFGNSFTDYASHTYRVKRFFNSQWNGIPHKDRPSVDTPRHTQGGANLYTHLTWMQKDDNNKKPNFKLDRWAWCVIQDQSITPAIPGWRLQMSIAARHLARFCQDENVPVMFMMTWGYRFNFNGHGVSYDYPGMTAALFDGYNAYVEESSTPEQPTYMAPCGLAWERVYQDCVDEGKDPRGDDCMWKDLYNKDGSHPGGKGATLCGMTIAVAMTGVSPYRMHYNPNENGHIGGKLVQDIMRDAVYRVITETYDSGKIRYPFDQPLEPRNLDSIWRPVPTFASTTRQAPNPDELTLVPPKLPSSPGVPASQLNMFFLGTSLVVEPDFLEEYLVQAYERTFPGTGIVLTDDHGSLSLEDHYQATYVNQISDIDTLEDHYYATYMNQVLDVEYDWVVLQEETDVASMGTYEPGEFLYDLITGLGGSNTMFLMPWAYQDGYKGFTFEEQTANLMGNTGKLAEEAEFLGLKAWIAPVGLAFEVVYLDCKEALPGSCLNLYQDDGMRANQNGKYLAALTTVAAMTGHDPVTMIEFQPQGIQEEAAQTLRDASRRAILYTIVKNVVDYPWDTSEWATTDFTD